MQTERGNKLTGPMTRTQEGLGQPLGAWLRERYLTDGWTTTQIGRELGLNSVTISRWLRSFGIELRFPGQRGKAV